jgi:hypothetical protein
MATKAERFRYAAERSGGAKKAPKAPAPKAARAKSPRQGKERQKSAVPLKAKQLLSVIAPTSRHEAAEAHDRHRTRG